MIGQTISHYHIVEKLGEGGMGVVYKAHDTKLDRFVALKFLPRQITVSEEDKARFLQEARAASAVMHPNVCVIYDIQEHEGQQFIIMEYVDGKTLRQLVPIQKTQTAIDYAIQIGEALQEAHSKGIVHRDVKTENIMVNSKNQIKVMDFGLAKLKGSLKLTKTSSTVGTLAYMAPEQIQGGEVDARSDIFSFGVVLFEMLTGHMPFRGEHQAAMVYSIVNEQPEPLQKYLPEVPSELVHAMSRALEKGPEDRYQSSHEMVIDLRRLKKDSARVSWPTSPVEIQLPIEASAGAAGKGVWQRRWLWLSVLGIVVIGVVLALLLLTNPRGVKLNPNRSVSTLPVPFTRLQYASISRDGNWIVFPARDENGKWDIYWMNIAGHEPSRITHERWPFGAYVDISPDAGQVVVSCLTDIRSSMQIRVVSLQGDASRTVADKGYAAQWMPRDGKRIGYLRRGKDGSFGSASGKFEVWSVNPDGSDNHIEFIDTLSHPSGPLSFCWSPDGGSIAWVRNFSPAYGEVVVRDLATGRERQLTSDKAILDEVVWATGDRILFVSNKSGHANLWAIPASGGEATEVTLGAVPVVGAKMSADAKKLVYLQQEEFTHIWISGLDGSDARQLTFDYVYIDWCAFSPDGNKIACALGGMDRYFKPGTHLYVMDRQGKNRRELTSGSEWVQSGIWSPDGKWIAFASRSVAEPVDSNRLFLIQPFNPGAPKLLCNWVLGRTASWVDDEELFVKRRDSTLWRCSITGGSPRRVPKDSLPGDPIAKMLEGLKDVAVWGYAISPDKKFLVYHVQGSNELWRVWASGRKEERVGQVPSGSMRLIDIRSNGKELLWLQDDMRAKFAVVENLFE
jgi:serine/threonine protein kinase